MKVEFDIDKKAFIETPNKQISRVVLCIQYDNPTAYGYPEVSRWVEEYDFDIEKIRIQI